MTSYEGLHPMFQEVSRRTDGWTSDKNESSLEYDFITRHPHMSITFLTLTGLACVIGNIGNVLVIGAVLSYRRLLRNTGNFFIVNLAVADLLITSVVGPMNMTGVVKGPQYFLDKPVLCRLLGSICTISCIVSMFSIAAVAVNRVVCICKYFMYRNVYSRRKTFAYCICLWLLAFVLDLPNWLGWGGHTFGLKEMGCTFDRMANHSFTLFLASVSIALPMVIVLVSYLAVFLYVRQSRATLRRVAGSKDARVSRNILSNRNGVKVDKNNSSVSKEDLQLAFTLFLTFIVFVACWGTYMVAIVFDYRDTWPKEVFVVGTLLGHSNSCLNSVIYAMCNQRFRQGYYVFVHKLFCLKIRRDSILKDSRVAQPTFRYTSARGSPSIDSAPTKKTSSDVINPSPVSCHGRHVSRNMASSGYRKSLNTFG